MGLVKLTLLEDLQLVLASCGDPRPQIWLGFPNQ